jgi:O-methyltransferase
VTEEHARKAGNIRLWTKRYVPRPLRRLSKRIRGLLLLDKRSLEHARREEFFSECFSALRFNGIGGDYLEFGCHGARTFAMAYHAARKQKLDCTFWAFDSFEGLPQPSGEADEHRKWTPGRMATSLDDFHRLCWAQRVPPNAYRTMAGFYEDSLAALGPGDAPADVCLAYIDCDLYSSTRSVLSFLEPRLKHGMVIAADDYHNYSPKQLAGERRALEEFFAEHPRWQLVPFLQIGWHGQSFIIEDREIWTAELS